MIVIEFCGLPGCGKSTISRKVFNFLRRENINVIEYRNPLNGCVIRKTFQAVYYLIKSVMYKRSRILVKKVLTMFTRLATMNGPKIFKNFFYFYKIIIIYAAYLALEKKENVEVLLIDQGIAQYLVSVVFRQRYTNAVFADFFMENVFADKKWNFVFCALDIEENLNRLKKRKNGKSRIEKCPVNEWKSELEQQSEDIEAVQWCCEKFKLNNIVISTLLEPNQNVEYIYKNMEIAYGRFTK